MTAVNYNYTNTISDSDQPCITTGAASDHELASTLRKAESNGERWQEMLDDYLIEWGRNPKELAEDDIIPPSIDLIRRACKFVILAKTNEWVAPARVVPDGDGGLSLEWYADDRFASLNFLDDDTIELACFENCRLVSRDPLNF